MTDHGRFRKCAKPDCMRKVSLASTYCCGPCATAAEGKFEIHQHSEPCDLRTAERGE